MHELSLIQKEVARAAQQVGKKKVRTVFFSLGKLAHGTPETIRNAFSMSVPNTPLMGAEVIVTVIEPRVKCSSCGYEFKAENTLDFHCPQCSGSSTEIVAGKECYIDRLDIEN